MDVTADDEVDVVHERRGARCHVHLPALGLGVASSVLGEDSPLVTIGENRAEHRPCEVRNFQLVSEHLRHVDACGFLSAFLMVAGDAEQALVSDGGENHRQFVQLRVRLNVLVEGHAPVDGVLHQVSAEDGVDVGRALNPVDVALKLVASVLSVTVVQVVQERDLNLALESGQLHADVRVNLAVGLLADDERPQLGLHLHLCEVGDGQEDVQRSTELVHLLEQRESLVLRVKKLLRVVAELVGEFAQRASFGEEVFEDRLSCGLLLLGVLRLDASQIVPLVRWILRLERVFVGLRQLLQEL